MIEAERFDRARVQEPHRSAAMLDPHWPIVPECIEAIAIDRTRDRFVISRAAQPSRDRFGPPQDALQVRSIIDPGWTTGNRIELGRQGEEV